MPRFRLLLRQLRTANQLSQEELARALNVSRQSIISLERGEYLPSAPVLIALMEFFRCNLPDLIEGMNIQKLENKHPNETQKGGEQSMQLTPWSPFSAVDRMHQEMSDVVERTFGRGDWSQSLGTGAGAMNIHETDKEYEIDVQVPGFVEDDLSIEMTEDMLTITGAKKQEEKKEGRNVIRREFSHTEFSRSIRFASPIKDGKVEAKLENGTLKIVAPKVEPAKPKTTKIQVKK
jgi:HSP20 family protein